MERKNGDRKVWDPKMSHCCQGGSCCLLALTLSTVTIPGWSHQAGHRELLGCSSFEVWTHMSQSLGFWACLWGGGYLTYINWCRRCILIVGRAIPWAEALGCITFRWWAEHWQVPALLKSCWWVQCNSSLEGPEPWLFHPDGLCLKLRVSIDPFSISTGKETNTSQTLYPLFLLSMTIKPDSSAGSWMVCPKFS